MVLIGNLTKDIEIIDTGTTKIAKSTVATSYKYKDKEEVCFLDFTSFGRSAEVMNQFLKKGSKVLLEGRLVLDQWEAQDGTKKSKHSLRVDNMKMLGNSNADTKFKSEKVVYDKANAIQKNFNDSDEIRF